MSLLRKIEASLFHTLNRKIAFNIGFLLFLQLAGFIVIYQLIAKSRAMLADQEASRSLIDQVISLQNSQLNLLLVFAAICAIVALVVVILFSKLFVKPVRQITSALDSINGSDGNISTTLPVTTQDELAELAKSYNKFSEKLCGIIDKIRRRTVTIALGSANLNRSINGAIEQVAQQEQRATQVFQSSSEATSAIDEIAMHTSSISDQNAVNLNTARASSDELTKAAQQVEQVSNLVVSFNETVNQLSQNSDNIRNIVSLVQEFSDQTNLLALNAAIEAARAGEYGRGFAVVADEVRSLSQKVNEATGEISKNISVMSELVESTKKETLDIQTYTDSTKGVISASSSQFESMVVDFEKTNEQLLNISSAIEELSITNKESHQNVSVIADLSKEVSTEMNASQAHSENLEMSTEQAQELLSRFSIGYGGFEDMIETARGWLKQISNTFDEMAASGINLFDQNYQPVANTNPQKYTVTYLEPFARAIQPLLDSFIQQRKEFLYTVVVDKNGYVPIHHSQFSKPLTGDIEKDIPNSRHQKIYNTNRTEVRRASNTEPFLLQTYLRDTGEMLNDLSLPIYVNGKHWGALIMGFNPQHLLNKD